MRIRHPFASKTRHFPSKEGQRENKKRKMKHIVLIGFKNTGKTVIGKGLAEKLALEFVDLDRVIEKKYGKGMKCREIIQKEGEIAFRRIETEALEEVLSINSALVLALGGGAAVAPKNQELMQGHTVILVTAPKEVLYERIMKKGR